jgi:hypothetical protein
LTIDEAKLFQTTMKRGENAGGVCGPSVAEKSDTGIADCCARAASGNAAAAPPSSVMNSRRLS